MTTTEKDKRTDNNLQNKTQNSKDRATQPTIIYMYMRLLLCTMAHKYAHIRGHNFLRFSIQLGVLNDFLQSRVFLLENETLLLYFFMIIFVINNTILQLMLLWK